MHRDSILAGLLATVTLLSRTAAFIFIPLYLDALKATSTIIYNISDTNQTDLFVFKNGTFVYRSINPYFTPVTSALYNIIVYGTILLGIRLFCSSQLTEADRSYPMSSFALAGSAMGFSTLLFAFSASGTRTAPYLQSLILNFLLPIQFVVRFIILQKRPTLRKLLCAMVVLVAEFVCLIPSVFPQLESDKAKAQEGGASGAGRVLWPICMALSRIPFATYNSVMERTVQSKEKTSQPGNDPQKLNMIYAIFWPYLFMLLFELLFFWMDLIPGFGTSPSIKIMGKLFVFNLRCAIGLEKECGFPVVLYSMGRMGLTGINFLLQAYLMRYSEGANFMVVVFTIRTPLLFLFWTLFEEHPFRWMPHVELSTWLSIGAIAVMIPAIVIYNTGPPEIGPSASREQSANTTIQQSEENEEERPLLSDEEHTFVPATREDTNART